MFKITISDGVTTQTRKLKPHVTKERAMEILENLYNNDYMCYSYYLLDENDNEIIAFEN